MPQRSRHTATRLFTLLGLATVLFVSGCNNQPRGPFFAGRQDRIPDQAYPKLAVIGGLHRTVVFGSPIITDAPGQPMSVVVPISNRSAKRDLHVEYKFEFFDEVGRPVEPEMSWKVKNLPHQAQVRITGTAIDNVARDWRFVVRPAR